MAKDDSKHSESRRNFMRQGLFRLARVGARAARGDLEGAAAAAEDLKATAGGAARKPPTPGVPAAAPKPAPAPAKRSDEPIWLNKQAGVPCQQLGRTNLMMSRLALGCSGIRKANSFIIRDAVDRGINFIETAINHGESELAVAEVLPKVRDRVWLCSMSQPMRRLAPPAGQADREAWLGRAIEENIDASLARLGADRIDLYLLQAVEEPDLLALPAVEDALGRARDKGKIVHAGVSTHRNVGNVFDAALKRSWCDAMMIPLNPLELSSMLTWIDLARFKQVGVIGMRATAALDALTEAQRHPTLKELPADWNVHQLTYRYMLVHAPVAGFVMGIDAPGQVEMNLAAAAHEMTINDGVELDAVVYSELWPYCAVCGEQRSIGAKNLEEAHERHYRWIDTAGMGEGIGGSVEEALRICESCQAQAEQGGGSTKQYDN